MGLKEQRKLDKKRKARDEKRKELRLNGNPAYEGDKYHTDYWAPYYLKIESTIFDCVLESKHTITGVHVRSALVRLIERLKKRQAITLAESDPVVHLAAGQEVDYLIYRIRQCWQEIFDELQPISLGDMAGLHRSLLASIDIQNDRAAGRPGYVNFLLDFIPRARPKSTIFERAIKLIRDHERE